MLLITLLLLSIIIGGWYFLVYIPDRDNKNNRNIKKSPKIKNNKSKINHNIKKLI